MGCVGRNSLGRKSITKRDRADSKGALPMDDLAKLAQRKKRGRVVDWVVEVGEW